MKLTKRQTEIIEAATILIGKKGLKNLTTKRLAAEMGFSEPALYRHFNGKSALLKAILLFYKNVMKEGLHEIINSKVNGLQKIHDMLNFQFNHFAKYPAVIMVIFSETSFQYDSVLSTVVADIMKQKRKIVKTMIRAGQEDGSIRNDIEALQLATVIMGSMRFTILRWRMADPNDVESTIDLQEEGKKIWETLQTILINKNQ